MWNKIKPFIDSGKKLKINGDKLITLALKNNFTGTFKIYSGENDFSLGFKKETVFTDKTPRFIAYSFNNALFSLSFDKFEEGKAWNAYELFFEIIKNYPEESIVKKLKKNNLRLITIKPEAGDFTFLKDELEKYAGRPEIPLDSFIKNGNSCEIYFLLLTEYAAMLDKSIGKKELKKEQLKETRRQKDEKLSPEEKLRKFLKSNMKYKNIPSLFKYRSGTSEKELHKTYKNLISVVHPDRLAGMPDELKEKAEKFAAFLNDAYKLMKDEKTREMIFELQSKFGDVKTPDDYKTKKEFYIILNKADALYKVRSYGVAYKLYLELNQNYKSKEVLEKLILCDMKNMRPEKDKARGNNPPDNKRATPKEKYERVLKHIEEIKHFGTPSIEIAFIEVEANEKLGNTKKALAALNTIINMDRYNEKALQWKKRLKFYATH